MNKHLKKIRLSSLIGLYCSMAIVAAIVAINYFSKWRITGVSQAMSRSMLVAGTVLAVLVTVVVLLTIRKITPRLRQLDDVERKLSLYAGNTARLYYSVLATVVIECLFVILSGNTILIMVTLLLVMMLFLAYPNMYKIKVDLGLDDETMKSLFGDKYVCEKKEWDERPIACVELGKDEPESEEEPESEVLTENKEDK